MLFHCAWIMSRSLFLPFSVCVSTILSITCAKWLCTLCLSVCFTRKLFIQTDLTGRSCIRPYHTYRSLICQVWLLSCAQFVYGSEKNAMTGSFYKYNYSILFPFVMIRQHWSNIESYFKRLTRHFIPYTTSIGRNRVWFFVDTWRHK